MRKHRNVWLLLLMTTHAAFSQEQPPLVFEDQPLSAVLEQLSDRYNIRFSYADEAIEDQVISYRFSSSDSLSHFLRFAETQTKLRFEQLNSQYVIIRPFSSDDLLTICGRIVSNDGSPAIGATVSVGSSSNQGVISDQNGQFTLTGVPFQETIRISYVGFQTRLMKASNFLTAECQEVKLLEAVSYLDEVVIQDYLISGSIKTNRKIEFDLQRLNMLPGLLEPDVLRSIQLTPGVNSPYETAGGIYVRGGAPDQNLVLWNGIKTYSQSHFFGMLSAFNPYTIKQVDFIKSGTSAAYGDRISSVIDISSNDEPLNQVEGGAGFDMIYADANISVPLVKDKLSLLVAGRRSYSDVIKTFTYNQFAERVFQNTKIENEATLDNTGASNEFFFQDFNVDLVSKPSKRDKLRFSALFSSDELDFLSSSQDQQSSFNDFLRTANNGFNLKWERQFNAQFSLSSNAYFSQYLLDYEFRNTVGDTTEVSSKKNLISDLGLNINAKWQLRNKDLLLSGYQFSNNRIRYAFENRTPSYQLVLDAANNEINTHSFYSEYQYGRPGKTLISGGLRFNYYTGVEEYFLEPRIYARHKISPSFSVNGTAEYRSQVVSQIQEAVISNLSLENQVWTLSSNGGFPVIDSYQFSLGTELNKNSWVVDLEAYQKKIDGITTLTFGFLNPIDNEYRIGDSDITGLDVFVKKKVNAYNTWIAYSYIRSENRFSGLNNNEPFPGNWNIEHTIKWSHFYQWKGLHFSLGWIWHTGKSFTEVTETPSAGGQTIVEFEGINAANLPVYHRLDFSMIYDFQPKGNQRVSYRVGLSIQNLYDRQNLLNQELRTTPSLNNELINTSVYSLGFTPNLVFRIFW